MFFCKTAFGVLDIAEKLGATDFVELLGEAALTKTLETEENITVFVPTNEAIQVILVLFRWPCQGVTPIVIELNGFVSL